MSNYNDIFIIDFSLQISHQGGVAILMDVLLLCVIEITILVHTKFHLCWLISCTPKTNTKLLKTVEYFDSIFAKHAFHQRLMYNLRKEHWKI